MVIAQMALVLIPQEVVLMGVVVVPVVLMIVQVDGCWVENVGLTFIVVHLDTFIVMVVLPQMVQLVFTNNINVLVNVIVQIVQMKLKGGMIPGPGPKGAILC